MTQKTNNNKISVAVSMLMYNSSADQNYEHDIDFLRKLSEKANVYLIVERGIESPAIEMKGLYVQTAKSRFLRIIQHFFLLLRLRLNGVTVFYSRNSLMNAVLAGLITRAVGGATYLWSCGEIRKGRAATRHEKGLFNYLLEIWAYRLSFFLIRGLVTGTRKMKEYYSHAFSIPQKKIFVLPNFVDLHRFSPDHISVSKRKRDLKFPDDGFVLLFPRSLSERHGTKVLPELISLLVDKGVDVYLVASGRGQLHGWLQDEMQRRGLKERLRILGGVPNIEMPSLFAASDVTIIPSVTEGFPRVLLESMAVGIPFVANSVGGVPDVIADEQTELLAPVGNLEKFAENIIRLYADSEWRNSMIEVGYKRVSEFDVSPVVDDFVHLFQSGSDKVLGAQ